MLSNCYKQSRKSFILAGVPVTEIYELRYNTDLPVAFNNPGSEQAPQAVRCPAPAGYACATDCTDRQVRGGCLSAQVQAHMF
jgi:hypothetical protein